jgi:hypothetical protein
MGAFYLTYQKRQTVSGKLSWSHFCLSLIPQPCFELVQSELSGFAFAAFPARLLRPLVKPCLRHFTDTLAGVVSLIPLLKSDMDRMIHFALPVIPCSADDGTGLRFTRV